MDSVKERIEKDAKYYCIKEYGDDYTLTALHCYIAGATTERNKAIEFVIQCINKHQNLPDTDTSGFYALENLKEELTAKL